MTTFDVHSNFAYGTISTAPSPGTSGTAMVLGTTNFADFPDPGTSSEYNMTVWPYGTLPLSSNAEIVRVVSKGANGTINFSRAQESSSAIDIQQGYQVAMTWTKKSATDIETAINNIEGSISSDGWRSFSETVTYSSGSAVVITGDYTSQFRKGVKFKFDQGGTTEYFACVGNSLSSGTTTLTLVGDAGTPIGTSAISNVYYSNSFTPEGYPPLFSWSPTLTGFSSNPSGNYYYNVKDSEVFAIIDQSSDGTSNATSFTISLPVDMNTDFNEQRGLISTLRDSGTLQATPGMWLISGTAPSTMRLYKDSTQAPWTNTGVKFVKSGAFQYSF